MSQKTLSPSMFGSFIDVLMFHYNNMEHIQWQKLSNKLIHLANKVFSLFNKISL